MPESDRRHSEEPAEGALGETEATSGQPPVSESETPEEPERPSSEPAPEPSRGVAAVGTSAAEPEADAEEEAAAPDDSTQSHGVVRPAESSGRVLHKVTTTLVVGLLGLAVLAFSFDLGPKLFGWDYPSPIDQPAEVAPPPGLTLPKARAAAPVADDLPEADASPAAVEQALQSLVSDPKLGPHIAVRVAELGGEHHGTEIYNRGAADVTPASTLKMLTSAAALNAMGPDHQFRTTVVADKNARVVTLVGGGDPLLARKPSGDESVWPQRADLATLARSTARELKERGRQKVRVHYDASLFTGPGVSPEWEPTYVAEDVVSPISALWVDEGRVAPAAEERSPDPTRAAADVFVRALAHRGIKVVGDPVATTAPSNATELAAASSPPLAQIVQYVLENSDNEGAEVLARQTAVATGRDASFTGGAEAVLAELSKAGVDVTGAVTYDGSGLSRQDRVRPETLLSVIETAASSQHSKLRTVVTGTPVAGFTGSLAYRFETARREGLGVVRAKTGTLTGFHGLSVTLTTRDGVLLGFVAVADQVKLKNTLAARDTLDDIAAALAACTCGETP